MKLYKLYLEILFCFFSLNLPAQNAPQVQFKKHRFSFYGGIGPNYYFNNLVNYKNEVRPWNYSVAARVMWEPEHFLSLGIESGYYQLYTVTYSVQPFGPAQVTNIAVPVQLVVSMRFFKNYYSDLSIGQTNLLYKFSSSELGSFHSSSWSLADFGIAAGYKHSFNNRISVGAETKFFHSPKHMDSNLAIVVMASCSF